jgi:hypothetical protein
LPDLIFVYGSGAVVRHENLGGTFGAAATVDAGPVSVAAAGDFNRDGRADLLLGRMAPAASGLPVKTVYLNDNAGGFTAGAALGATPTRDLALGDVDGNGSVDFVSVNATGAHQAYLGDGNGGFTLQPLVAVAAGATRGAFAPIGLLQKADLVVAGADATAVFFNDGLGSLGLGDTTRPVIQLNGPPEVIFEVGGVYSDQGAVATDNVDGTVTPSVTNPVDPKVIGTYAVTYAATDKAGNAALPVARTVRVNAAASQGGGGGGALGALSLFALLGALAAARSRRFR